MASQAKDSNTNADVYKIAIERGRPDVAQDMLNRETDPAQKENWKWSVREAERVQRDNAAKAKRKNSKRSNKKRPTKKMSGRS